MAVRWAAALLLLSCSSTDGERFQAMQAQPGLDSGTDPVVDLVDAPVETATVDAGSEPEPEASGEAGVFDAGHDAPKDRCPPGSVGGYPTVPALRLPDPRVCFTQDVNGRFAPWPEDGGSPDVICCKTTNVAAWRDVTGCGEVGIML